jgi:hypothetical protein
MFQEYENDFHLILGKFYEITFNLKDNSLSNSNPNEIVKNEQEKRTVHNPNENTQDENGSVQIVHILFLSFSSLFVFSLIISVIFETFFFVVFSSCC